MQSFAQKIDLYLLGLYKDIPYNTGTAGTTPSSISDITNARQILGENLVPLSNRRLVIDPACENEFLQIPTFHEADKLGDNGTALREASLGRKFGFDIYSDKNVLTHTAGTLAVGSGKPKVKAAVSAGANELTLSATSLTGTVSIGDVITVGKQSFSVTENATAVSNEVTIKISPAVKSDISANAEVTLTASHTANLAFHKNAFSLVTRPLALPKGLADGQKAIVNYDGFGLRVIYDYNSQFKKDIVSIDMLCGVKTLDSLLACRMLG